MDSLVGVNVLCDLHITRLGPGAVCPVCTTGERVMKLERTILRLATLLTDVAVEWSTGPYRNRCPWCDDMHGLHRETCPQQAALSDPVVAWVLSKYAMAGDKEPP